MQTPIIYIAHQWQHPQYCYPAGPVFAQTLSQGLKLLPPKQVPEWHIQSPHQHSTVPLHIALSHLKGHVGASTSVDMYALVLPLTQCIVLMLHVTITCCFNVIEHNMCTVFYTTLWKSCVVYIFASLTLESLEIDSIHVQCSNTIFATNTHIEMNAINLTLSFCIPAEVRL